MRQILLIISIMLLLNISIVSAHDNFNETKQLIDSGITCDKLTDEQLEAIGEYYMEQMHPGEAHEIMDKMMGGEGSKSLKQMHINMARRLYCNENVYIGYGMMGSGGLMGMWNIMSGGMIGGYPLGYSYANNYWNILWALLFAAVIFLIVWIFYRFGIKRTAYETPLNILKKRFAKGKITKKEFNDMKKEVEE